MRLETRKSFTPSPLRNASVWLVVLFTAAAAAVSFWFGEGSDLKRIVSLLGIIILSLVGIALTVWRVRAMMRRSHEDYDE
jgi:membrane protein DedA with SNARE-associated domain